MTFRTSLFLVRRPAWTAGLSALCAAALMVAGCGGGEDDTDGGVLTPTTIIEANINTLAAQVGGGTQDVELYNDGTTDWTLFTMANRFAATPVGMSKGAVSEIRVPGYIQHITVIKDHGGQDYALLSMGGKGIGVVNITNPAAMSYVRTMTVSYQPPAYTYSDGGGTIFTEPAAAVPLTAGPVSDLLVDDQGTSSTDDDELFVANEAYGIQKTKLTHLMNAATDGVLTIDGVQAWTMKYAGENPWGGPLSLRLHGGRLYAALGFLGVGIFDAVDLSRLGVYNLYTDCANSAQEDWFGFPDRKPACNTTLLANPANLDADGMPTYAQAAAELGEKNSLAAYPWAEFDRYGKYYYNARSLDLADLPNGETMAYVAYSLGGLVAVNMTNPAEPAYIGYVPAAPAHGPDKPPVNADKKGILSHSGSGMLKEAGVMNVRVTPDPDDATKLHAYYTDHFAGLVVVRGAEAPATQWRNGSFNNDTNPRVFWPDYEFVKSYDMTPVPVGDESMPRFLTAEGGNFASPVMLVTGEINGHGGSLFLLAGNFKAAGQVDVVESSGAGGLSFVDIIDLTTAGVDVANRFAVPVNVVSTNEIGAFEDGSAGQPIAIGHTEGVTVSGNHLYLADGPHGVSVWRIADGLRPIDDLHLVANTLQSEYPTGDAVLPTPHAFKVAFGTDPEQAYVMSQSPGHAPDRRVGRDQRGRTSGSACAAQCEGGDL